VVVFDVYKTLLDITIDEDDRETYTFIARWLACRGVRITPENVFKLYKKIAREEMRLSKQRHPDIDIGKVFGRIISAGETAGDGHLIKELSLLFRVLTTRSLRIYPHASDVLKQLHNKVRLAIVSNSQRLFTMPELVQFDIAKYFEYILFSSDAGACKPDPAIFRRMLKSIKARPRDVIFVGDDLCNDIAAAKNAGMKVVWINHGQPGVSPSGRGAKSPDSEVKISDYRDLPDVILSLI
jgi:putative hydrolase of the HAD superfamily